MALSYKILQILPFALVVGCSGTDKNANSTSSTFNSTSQSQSILSSSVFSSSSFASSVTASTNVSSSSMPASLSSAENQSSASSTLSECTQFKTPTTSGEFANNSGITGPSGISASRQYNGVIYAHLDAGGPATVFVVTNEGAALGKISLQGVAQIDWEDIAVGPGPNGDNYIYIGDFGDNAPRLGGTPRDSIDIYRFLEPAITTLNQSFDLTMSDFERLSFNYPDAPHDAETLIIDPITQDILILTKEDNGVSNLYRAPTNLTAGSNNTLELIANVQIGTAGQSGQATAGDASPLGDQFIVRTYSTILLWRRLDTLALTFTQAPIQLPSPTEPQSEGITFTIDGKTWLSAGERSPNIYIGGTDCE